MLGVDLIGACLKSVKQNEYLMVIVDYYSKSGIISAMDAQNFTDRWHMAYL